MTSNSLKLELLLGLVLNHYTKDCPYQHYKCDYYHYKLLHIYECFKFEENIFFCRIIIDD